MRINTNISAIIANQELDSTETKLSKSLERLSSGYKINHSKDDPAGLAISQKMRTQLKGLDQSDHNAQDGVSVLQTAEGGMTEIQSMLARMKELSVQAANDVNSKDERAAIQQEIDALTSEIDRIATDTDFNTKSLLNGDLQRRVYSNIEGTKQVEVTDGFPSGIYGLTVTSDAKAPQVDGVTTAFTATEATAGTLKLNGVEINIDAGDTADIIQSKLIDGATKAGATFDYNTGTIKSLSYGSNEQLKVECDNEELLSTLGLPTGTYTTDENGAIYYTGADVEATFTEGADGRVGFEDTATISTYGNTIYVRDNNNRYFELQVPDDATSRNGGAIEQTVTDLGTLRVHVGANENQIIDISLPEVSSDSLGLSNIFVHSFEMASEAIEKVDTAVSRLSSIRSKIGSYQNRLEHTMTNLSVSSENLTTAYSRILDVDMAEEMTEYTQANVLAQAGTSMLSQANARPEMALQLLQK